MFSTGAGYGTKAWAFLKKEDQYRTLQQRFLLAAEFLSPFTPQDTSHAFRSTSPLECTLTQDVSVRMLPMTNRVVSGEMPPSK